MNKHRGLLILFFFNLGLFIRLGAFLMDPILTRDSFSYIYLAECIYQENGFDSISIISPNTMTPPFFLSAIVGLMDCGLSAEKAAILLNIISGAFVPIIAGCIAQELFQSRKMFWATLVLATFHPTLIELSKYGQRDMVNLFLIGCVFYLTCLTIYHQRIYYAIGIGLLLPLSCLTRYESLELIPVLSFLFIASHFFTRISWKKISLYSLIICSTSILTLFIYIRTSGTKQYILDTYTHFCDIKIRSGIQSYDVDQVLLDMQ